MVKYLLLAHLLIFGFFTKGQSLNCIDDLKPDWLIYNEKNDQFLPYLDLQLKRNKTLFFTLNLSDEKNEWLSVKSKPLFMPVSSAIHIILLTSFVML